MSRPLDLAAETSHMQRNSTASATVNSDVDKMYIMLEVHVGHVLYATAGESTI
jgi:hypothetical protein